MKTHKTIGFIIVQQCSICGRQVVKTPDWIRHKNQKQDDACESKFQRRFKRNNAARLALENKAKGA